ncbi:hypothetical protein ACC775_37985, partial [Rhizobium ruizarguesonis]
TMIFLIAVFVFHEPFVTARMIAFPLIWAGLFLYSWPMHGCRPWWRRRKRRHRAFGGRASG